MYYAHPLQNFAPLKLLNSFLLYEFLNVPLYMHVLFSLILIEVILCPITDKFTLNALTYYTMEGKPIGMHCENFTTTNIIVNNNDNSKYY